MERSEAKFIASAGSALENSAPKELKKVVNTRAIWGGLVLALPLFGLDSIIYGCILWGMYGKIARMAGVKFSGSLVKNTIGGFILNLVITFVLNFFFDWLAVFGWIGNFILGYVATRYSGIMYLGVLETMHGSKKMKTTLNFNNSKEDLKNAGKAGAQSAITQILN